LFFQQFPPSDIVEQYESFLLLVLKHGKFPSHPFLLLNMNKPHQMWGISISTARNLAKVNDLPVDLVAQLTQEWETDCVWKDQLDFVG